MDIKQVAKAMQHIEFVLFTLKCGDSLKAGEAEQAHKKAQEIMKEYLLPMGAFED